MSELVRAEKLSFRRGPALVLREVSLTVSSGEHVGLVGANGAGKSTLLALLAGTLQRSEGDGSLRRAPGVRIGYLQQSGAGLRGTLWAAAQAGLGYVRGLEAALRAAETQLGQPGGLERYGDLTEAFERAGGYEAEATLQAHLSRLGFGPHDYERDTASLSGGERARLALARVLAERPDLLLLDEPSTYLDLPTRRWLADTLAGYPAALLLASHDRALLDAATRRTLQLERGAVTSYRGGYSRFAAQHAHASARLGRVAARAAHERRALAARIQGQPTLSTRRSLERRLARLPRAPVYRTAKTPALTLEAPPAPINRVLLEARNLSLSYPAQTDQTHANQTHANQTQSTLLLDDVSLRVYSGDKLALVGPNGAGKTSLLKLLAGDLEPDPAPEAMMQLGGAPVRLAAGVKLAVFDQHGRGLEDGVPLGKQLGRSVSEPRAHSLLALVGLPDGFEALPEALSGGQRARAGVALLLAAGADLLLLDEPSEQLDVAMVETLETALADTGAALVFSSHDAALVDAVATRVLGLNGGKLLEYRGGLAGYYAGTLRLEPGLLDLSPETDAAADNATNSATESDPEAELAALEDETAAVEELLADPLRLSERDRWRLMKRQRELIDARCERYDARLPAPRPRYRALEGGLYIWTNGVTQGGVTAGGELTGSAGMGHPVVFSSDAGLTVHLYLEQAPNEARRRVGHLVLQPDPARCTLPWAETAVVRGAVRLAFEVFGVQAVQLQRARDLSAAGLAAAGDDWWLLSLERYLNQEGWLRPARLEPQERGRKLVYADDWQRWAQRRKTRRKSQAKPRSTLQPPKPAK